MKISLVLRFALVAALLAAFPAGCAGSQPPPASMASPLLDKQLPAFRRPALDGTTVDTATSRGHVVVVKFFAKYCEPCKKTLPEAEAIHKERADVVFIGVAEDEHDSDAQEMVQQFGLTFPVVHDQSNVLSGRFRVSDMPTTFVADKQGNIRWVGGSGQTGDDLRRAIDMAER